MTPTQQRIIKFIQEHVAATNGRWRLSVKEMDCGIVESFLQSTKCYDTPIQFFIGKRGGLRRFDPKTLNLVAERSLKTHLDVYVRA